MNQTRTIIIALLIIGISSRLIPHYPNFTAIGAISLFGAAFAGKRSVAIILPFLIMLISDMVLNNLIYVSAYPADYSQTTFFYKGALWTYAALGIIVIFGYSLFRNGVGFGRVFFGAVGASVIFYLISNFGVWAMSTIYPVNFGGLISCYAAGLPFLVNQLMADIFFSMMLFGIALHIFQLKPKMA